MRLYDPMSFKNAIESSDIFDFQIAQDSRAARGAGWHLAQLPVKPCLRIHAPAARMRKQKLLNHPWWKVEPEHNKNIENNFGVYICWLQKKCWRTWNIIVPACSVHIYIYCNLFGPDLTDKGRRHRRSDFQTMHAGQVEHVLPKSMPNNRII